MKIKNFIGWSLSLATSAYLLLILFPQIVFANRLDYKNFSVYYHNNDNHSEDSLMLVIDTTITLLERSELYKENIQQDLYLCDSYGEFTFFSLLNRKSFAVQYPLIQNIFLTTSSSKEDIIIRNDKAYNERSLSSVIAHETTHSLLENELGVLSYKMLPSWKNEGYCDYIANESSFKTNNEKFTICDATVKEVSHSFTYFKYRKLIEYLFETEGMNIQQFVSQPLEIDLIKSRFCYNFNL